MILLEGLSHISLGTSDVERAVNFYGELLDFEVVEREENYAIVHLDPIHIRLNLIPGYRAAAQSPAETSLSFILDVDDFTNAITDLEEKDIEILEGPVAIEGGESILIADPDGNLIEMFYRE